MSPLPFVALARLIGAAVRETQRARARGDDPVAGVQRLVNDLFDAYFRLLYPLLVLGGFSGSLGRTLEDGNAGSALALAITGWLVFGYSAARLVAVPLGWVRTAYVLSLPAPLAFPSDRKGGAALVGAWALCRQRTPDARAADWLRRRLLAKRLRGAGTAAAGLLAAAHGDDEGARALLERVEDFPKTPRRARTMAREWLAALAAERGEWAALVALGACGPKTRTIRLLAAAARRLTGDPRAPSDAWQRALWLLAPRRGATRALRDRALACPVGLPIEPARPIRLSECEGGALGRAMALEAALERRSAPKVLADDLVRLGAAWDEALAASPTQVLLRARSAALETPPEGVVPGLRAAAEDVLVALAERTGCGLPPDARSCTVAGGAARRLRARALEAFEATCAALRRRVEEARELPTADEWREHVEGRRLHARVVRGGGEEARRLAFPTLHRDVCKQAVWLYNVRKERPLGHAMFRFLLVEAEAAGDAEAIALQRKNVACGA